MCIRDRIKDIPKEAFPPDILLDVLTLPEALALEPAFAFLATVTAVSYTHLIFSIIPSL